MTGGRRRQTLHRLGLTGWLLCGLAPAAPSPALAQTPSGTEERQSFGAFLERLWPEAQKAGIRRATFDTAFPGLVFDPAPPRAAMAQPEFDRPLRLYLAQAAGRARRTHGRALHEHYSKELDRLEQGYGVPGEILIAAWGMESDYGRLRGTSDLFRSLASLAYALPERPLYAQELIAALKILESGKVRRADMQGSWAGAMGDPQFLPSAYLAYGIGFDGQPYPDLWHKPADTLTSIANFLARSGWQRDLPWGVEVRLPQGLAINTLHRDFADWKRDGVTATSGDSMPERGAATLFLPAGRQGPAFLLSDNYWIIKAYNNSDAYALSLALLADSLKRQRAAKDIIEAQWPETGPELSRKEKAAIQHHLQSLGLYQGTIDGRFGQASRDAIHAYQKRLDPKSADGFATQALYRQMVGAKVEP